MVTLRITQNIESPGRYRVETLLMGDSIVPRRVTTSFAFAMTPQEQEDLRWYLEDFLQFPQDPAPAIAAGVERRMVKIGTQLFQKVFQNSKPSRELWSQVCEDLCNVRIEVVTDLQGTTAIPWELMRDATTDTVLVLHAKAFVRTHSDTITPSTFVNTETEPIRILLVISRPRQEDDVPFRSIAIRLVKALTDQARAFFQLVVLRPPTFERMCYVLQEAQEAGRPYHIVHFDGHGEYTDPTAEIFHRPPDPLKMRGYVLFEAEDGSEQLVDGTQFGAALANAGVLTLVLNACRSAHAEPPPQPHNTETADQVSTPIHSFGSLAQEVMKTGVLGVVAMRYNVYVVTAAQFVANLYAALVQGVTLGQAVTLGRKQLADQPERSIAFTPQTLQDWCVPVVYEAMPIALFPARSAVDGSAMTRQTSKESPGLGALHPQVPKSPDAGFFGRDETLMAIDRAFDAHAIVLLHAYAGSGKSATAVEFARWYSTTGGLNGPVMFTSFSQYLTLPRVLDQIFEVFGQQLQQSGVNWLALDATSRREIVLQVLAQVPVLWIWDNVELIAGFPTGNPSQWSDEEQNELVLFLRDAAGTKAKVLLTSRRDELSWLGNALPHRIMVPPMSMQEGLQLATALADRQGYPLNSVDWLPLLQFARGNPLTITVLMGQALREHLSDREQIEAFIDKLRGSEATFTDEADEGRSRSLGAALAYGFDNAFSHEELQQLSVLHLFQDIVGLPLLGLMTPDHAWGLPELSRMTAESARLLLDRAAEIGMLTPLSAGFYFIHPALPWFLKRLFTSHVASKSPDAKARFVRAFVEAISRQASSRVHEFVENAVWDQVDSLSYEEPNLLSAIKLAKEHAWHDCRMRILTGLRVLYTSTGRFPQWQRVIHEVLPDYIDPYTEGPLQGVEDSWWRAVLNFKISLVEYTNDWREGVRLSTILINKTRPYIDQLLSMPLESWSPDQCYELSQFAGTLTSVGSMLFRSQELSCTSVLKEAFDIFTRLGHSNEASDAAILLGNAYKEAGDLNASKHWIGECLRVCSKAHRIRRGECFGVLAQISKAEARRAETPDALTASLQAALDFYLEALEAFPPDALRQISQVHNEIGTLFVHTGYADRALAHYRESLRLKEHLHDRYGTAMVRNHTAAAMWQLGRLSEARQYAAAALRDYETLGGVAAADIEKTRQFIADIEAASAS